MLDEEAFDSALADDADGALTLLGALVGATDQRLAEAARRLAGPHRARPHAVGRAPSPGVGRMEVRPADRADGDLDLDASLEPLQLARAGGTVPPLDELRVSAWGKPSTAFCLVIDRSGSMNGTRLATAALAAAACAWRSRHGSHVVAFADDVVVVKSQDVVRRARGGGRRRAAACGGSARPIWPSRCGPPPTSCQRSRAQRQVTILLSDCRPTTGSDPLLPAVRLDELVVMAPADDCDDAAAFARSCGARWTPLDGPSAIPDAFARLLD